MKYVGQIVHWNLFLIPCIFSKWLSSPLLLANEFPHLSQYLKFDFVCILSSCFFTCPFVAKVLSQNVHIKGFSPVCILWWIFNLVLSKKCLSQMLQIFALPSELKWPAVCFLISSFGTICLHNEQLITCSLFSLFIFNNHRENLSVSAMANSQMANGNVQGISAWCNQVDLYMTIIGFMWYSLVWALAMRLWLWLWLRYSSPTNGCSLSVVEVFS